MRKAMNDLLEDFKKDLKHRRLKAEAEKDAKVIEQCQNGDLKAFEELVRRYMPTAVRISMGYLRNTEEAVDCSQDAFVQALEALTQFDNTKPFFPWFYMVIRNACLKKLRRIRQLKETPFETVEEKTSKLDGFQRNDLSDAVKQALGQLNPEQQEVILLRHWENLSYETIATVTGQPLGTIMSRLHYARQQLSELLSGLEKL